MLLKLSIREFEQRGCLVARNGQPINRALKGFLAFHHFTLQPPAPAEVEKGLSYQRALRELTDNRLEATLGLQESIGWRERICDDGNAICFERREVLPQFEFAEKQKRLIRRRCFWIFVYKLFQSLRCVRGFIEGERQLCNLPERLPLGFRRQTGDQVFLIGFNRLIEPAEAL